jgi:hypothetical protein
MSHGNFNFPQNSSSLGVSPFNYVSVPAVTDGGVEPDGVVDEFAGGSRRGEDLLLTNVHTFEIEVWDDRIGDFLPIGHSRTAAGPDGIFGNADDIPGDYHFLRQRPTTTGISIVPGDSGNWSAATPTWMSRIFDTWHPAYDHDGDEEVDTNGDGLLNPGEDFNGNGIRDRNHDPAPYRPLTLYPPGSTYGPTPNQGNWTPNTQYNVGDVVFPKDYRPQDHGFVYRCTRAGLSFPFDEDLNGNGALDEETDDNPTNGSVDLAEETIIVNGVFDTEDTNGNMILDDSEPAWQTTAGAIIDGRSEDNNPRDGVLSPIEDFNGNGMIDVEPQWVAISNVRPIRAVRLRVRFLHVASGEMRQLSLVFSLTEN